jgi:hypothetical protein
MGDMGMWGLSPNSPLPTPISITSKSLPLIKGRLDPKGTSPRPLVPIFEPSTTSRPPAAAWLFATQLFDNLSIPHSSLRRRPSRIMALVFQHLAVGEHTP